jgi:D-glycero-D-manno-heptose 1,7-bisphosphate phosphatase
VAVTRAIFVDKDGTLVEDVPYNADSALLRLTDSAGPALARLRRAGYRIVVVSNQSGVARGRFPQDALDAVEARLRDLLASHGVALDGVYWCPHHPHGLLARYAVRCDCRKPAPGLLLRAAGDLGLDLASSWMVGDILDDVEAGHRAGCRSVLVDRGGETEWRLSPERSPDAVAPNLGEAADLILARDGVSAEALR